MSVIRPLRLRYRHQTRLLALGSATYAICSVSHHTVLVFHRPRRGRGSSRTVRVSVYVLCLLLALHYLPPQRTHSVPGGRLGWAHNRTPVGWPGVLSRLTPDFETL